MSKSGSIQFSCDFFERQSNDDLINDKHMSERNEDNPLIVSEIKFHRNNLYMVLSCRS